MKTKTVTHPNRIDYIVYSNPTGARNIIDKYGYQAPSNKRELCAAMKQLVREQGKPVIKELLLIHPEKEIILEAAGCNSKELNYCGCQHSSYLPELTSDGVLLLASTLSDENLLKALDTARSKANKDPKNEELKELVEVLQKEYDNRQKKNDKNNDEQKDSIFTDKNFLIGAVLGVVVGIILTKIS